MPQERICAFCHSEIAPGTGKMFVKNDGTVYYFCSGKCEKNLLKLKRVPWRVKWTEKHRESR